MFNGAILDFGPFGGYVTETHITASDRFFVEKKVCGDISYIVGQAHVLVTGICCC